MKRDKNKDRHALLAAAALQDHMARRLRMPGGPVAQPSMQPGAPMTLAQHLGLIPRPARLLTEDEWTEVHLKSRLRQDSEHECVICREEFQAGAQVLLSCSHTFHRHCLASFERYSRSKVCPLCRAEGYQKKLIRDGQNVFRHKCATRIQAAWRGYAARRRFRQLRRQQPPRDERLRKKWAAERLQEESDRLLSALDDEVGDLDELFAELDASVAASRAVCDAALRPLAARLQAGLQRDESGGGRHHQGGEGGGLGGGLEGAGSGRSSGAAQLGAVGGRQRGEEEGEEEGASSSGRERRTAVTLIESDLVALARGPQAAGGSSAVRGTPTPTTTVGDEVTAAAGGGGGSNGPMGRPVSAAAVDWDAVVARARSRGAQECPICLGDIARRGNEAVAWLSCTHCFHVDCIMAFEAFELASGGTPTCPVCRSGYRRRCFP